MGASPLWAAPLETFDFRVAGADSAVTDRLRGASVLVPLANQSIDDPQEVLAAARAEYSRLLGALYDMGYYGGVITVSVDGREAASIPALETPQRIRSVVVTVNTGPLYTFSRAEVAPVAPGSDIPPGYAPGQPARTATIRATAEAAVTGWRRLGYAKAEVSDQSITADHRVDTVDSDLRLAPGRQLRYGTIAVRGADRVREDRILFMSGLRPGSTFNPEELQDAANRIRRSGAFRSVAVVEAEEANPDGTIDIALQVAEERLRRYGVGFEYSTVEGWGLDAFWLHRNLFGGAERLLIEGSWTSIGGDYTGGADYALSARYTRTSSFGPDTDFYIFTELEQLNEPTFTSNSLSFELGYTREVRDDLTLAAAVGAQYTSVEEDGETTDFYMLTLPLQATYDTRDEILNATRGFYLDTDLTPFAGFDGTGSGVYLYGDGRTYYTIGETRPLTLAGRVQVGSIAGAALDTVPNDMRFFSGGGGTVRGQDYEFARHPPERRQERRRKPLRPLRRGAGSGDGLHRHRRLRRLRRGGRRPVHRGLEQQPVGRRSGPALPDPHRADPRGRGLPRRRGDEGRRLLPLHRHRAGLLMRLLRLLALLLLLPTALLAQEESGASFLERTLESNLSGAGRDVRVTGFRGALSSTATMERLTIADDQGIWLTLEGVTLDWSRTALLRGRLSVQTLSADRIDLARLPAGGTGGDMPAPEASGFRLPELPISVNIGRIASPSITIGEPVFGLASTFTLEGSLSLEGGEGTGSIDITRLDGPQGNFAIDAAFSNATGILTLDAALTEAQGGIVSTLAGLPGAPRSTST